MCYWHTDIVIFLTPQEWITPRRPLGNTIFSISRYNKEAMNKYLSTLQWFTVLKIQQYNLCCLYHANILRVKSDTAQVRLTALQVWACATEHNKLKSKHAHRKQCDSFLGSTLSIPVKGMFQHAASVCPQRILTIHHIPQLYIFA